MPTRWDRFRETFALDLRSLALLRIFLGLMLLVDLAIRTVDLSAHYTDAGILPRDYQELAFFRHHPARFSLHMASGELPLQIVLFALAAILAVSLSFGFFTRLSLLGSLILYISIQNRNTEIETGGDYLLRLVCFWCLFLPLGARFSLDRRAGRVRLPEGQSNQHFSVATVALLLQMMVVYFFSALHKDHPIWRSEFTAIHYALHIDAYDTALGEWLRQFPFVTQLMTRATLTFEYAAPWFLVGAGLVSLVPGLRSVYGEQAGTRTVAVLVFILFHVGLGASIALGTFAWFAALIWFGFFPTAAWDTLNEWVTRRSEPGVESGGLARALFRVRRFVLEHEAPLRGAATGTAARLRQLGGTVAQIFAGICAVIMLLWNVATLEPQTIRYLRGQAGIPTPDVKALVDLVRLDQHWGLFAPYPRTSDGYYVVLVTLQDGSELDILRPGFELTWEKPDDVSGSYKTFRWRKYFRNIRRGSKRAHRNLYAEYVCREYNHRYGSDHPAKQVEIYFMRRKTLREGGHAPARKERIHRERCPRTPSDTERS